MKKCILLATIIPSMLFGQNNADTLKFEIIKASIKFLSTDNKSFPKSSGKVISCTFRDGYDCLKKYCKNNGLKGGEIKIDVWKKEIVNSKETLEDMKDKILKELTTGTVAKERLNLSGFGAYKIAITQLTTSFSEHDPQAEALNSDIENTKSITEIINPIVVEETNLNNQNKSKSKLPLFAFLFSFLALALSVINFFKGSRSISKKYSTNTDIQLLLGEVNELKSKLAQKQSIDLTPLQNSINKIENKIYNLENQFRSVELEIDKDDYIRLQSNISNSNAQIVFAKLPDLGNGFSSSIINSSQNGEQIYEIEIHGDKATFTLSEDLSAQKYVLPEAQNYLSSACDFINQPIKGSRIVTFEKGTLLKMGVNWMIQSKAKIEFK